METSQSIRVHLVASPMMLWGLERMVELAPAGMKVAGSSTSLESCLTAVAHSEPDVVVVDLDGEDHPDALIELTSHTAARVLALTGTAHATQQDRAVLAGARGVVSKCEPPATLLKAIERVHAGEIWIDRDATGRIFMQLVRGKAGHPGDPAQEKIATLTRRERQTVAALASDASAPGKVIADRLNMSEHTLRNHLTSIYGKLGLTNRVDLYAFAHKHGLAEVSRVA